MRAIPSASNSCCSSVAPRMDGLPQSKSQHTAAEFVKTLQLLGLVKLDQFGRARAFTAEHNGPGIASEKRTATNQVGLAHQLESRPEELPERMPAEIVVLPA